MQDLNLFSRALTPQKHEQKRALILGAAAFMLAALSIAQVLLLAWMLAVLTQGQGIITLLLIFSALALMAIALRMALTQQADRLAHRARAEALMHFFEKILSQPQTVQTPHLVEIMQRGVDQIYFVILSFFRDHLVAAFSLLIALPVALALHPQMALLLFTTLALFAFLNLFLSHRALESQGDNEKFHAQAASRAAEIMGNAQLVQVYTRLDAETRVLDETMRKLLAAQNSSLDWFARKDVVFGACFALGLTCLLALGSYLYSEAQLGLFEIVSFAILALLLLDRLETLTGFGASLFIRTKPLAGFFNLLDAEMAVKERPEAKTLNVQSGGIEFRNVTTAGVAAFDLSIAPKEVVAIVGDISSIATLLLRYQDPQEGTILIDKQNIAEITLASLRQNIALAGGQVLLPNRTIMENLAIARPGATQAQIIEAVKKAGAHDFIGAKPEGFHTLVTENALSELEAERIGLARAFLKEAPIVVFEETQTTSKGDISDALDRLLPGKTVILLPRRLSTLQKATRVIVVQKGAIAESGTYEELVQKQCAFANLLSEGHFASSAVTQLSMPKPLIAKGKRIST